MILVVRGAADKLAANGIDLESGRGVEMLDAILRKSLPYLVSWGYSFETHNLDVTVPDEFKDEAISALSVWGTAEVKSDAGY